MPSGRAVALRAVACLACLLDWGALAAPLAADGPFALHTPPLLVPDEAAGLGLAPEVAAKLSIDPRGVVTAVEVLSITPASDYDALFRDRVIETFSSWRFAPATENGRPVASTLDWRVRFPAKALAAEMSPGPLAARRRRRRAAARGRPRPCPSPSGAGCSRSRRAPRSTSSIRSSPARRRRRVSWCAATPTRSACGDGRREPRGDLQRPRERAPAGHPAAGRAVQGPGLRLSHRRRSTGRSRPTASRSRTRPASTIRSDSSPSTSNSATFRRRPEHPSARGDARLSRSAHPPPGSRSAALAGRGIRRVRRQLGHSEGASAAGQDFRAQVRLRGRTVVAFQTGAGEQLAEARAALRRGEGLGVKQMLEASPEIFYGEDAHLFYASSWLLVHYLRDGGAGWSTERFPAAAALSRRGLSAGRRLSHPLRRSGGGDTAFRQYVKSF